MKRYLLQILTTENIEKLRLACEQAQSFGSEVFILSGREIKISGTEIRKMGAKINNIDSIFPNSFVKEVFNKP